MSHFVTTCLTMFRTLIPVQPTSVIRGISSSCLLVDNMAVGFGENFGQNKTISDDQICMIYDIRSRAVGPGLYYKDVRFDDEEAQHTYVIRNMLYTFSADKVKQWRMDNVPILIEVYPIDKAPFYRTELGWTPVKPIFTKCRINDSYVLQSEDVTIKIATSDKIFVHGRTIIRQSANAISVAYFFARKFDLL